MSQGANLQDSGLLDDFSRELVKIQEEIQGGLRNAQNTIAHEIQKLESSRKNKIREVEKCQENLRIAQKKLESCMNEFHNGKKLLPCSQEKQNTIIARQCLNKALEDLRIVSMWKKRVEQASTSFNKSSHIVANSSGKAIPRARAVLAGKIRSIEAYSHASLRSQNPSKGGNNFSDWAKENLFQGMGLTKKLLVGDNLQMDPSGDDIGLTKDRIPDYITSDGDIWEFKSGYENGGIDQDQLREYRIMQETGSVRYYVNENSTDYAEIPVKSINYLFETRAGAIANASNIDKDVVIWFLDENGLVQFLDK
jgi:hypothetical protein